MLAKINNDTTLRNTMLFYSFCRFAIFYIDVVLNRFGFYPSTLILFNDASRDENYLANVISILNNRTNIIAFN